jgi:serine/threonine protein kinase
MHEGQPMIADFGIALAVSEASGQRLTETGLSIGTPHYMSPEQAMGDRELDARSDVYSLGAMLYEMLAGEPPYSGTTAQASGDTIYYAFAAFQPTTAVAVAAEDQLRVLDRSQGVTGIVDLNVRAEVNWDVGPDGDEFLFIGREQDAEDELPSLIWVLNWPELARTLGGGS